LSTSQTLIATLQESERTLEHKVRERTQNLERANELLSEQAQEIQIANTTLQEQNITLADSREHIERLMLNILPKPIAIRLQAGEKSIADRHESVTVLFADIVDFTKLSANIAPEELVALLDALFSEFDELVEQYQLEKIKTIGDAYMVVGGLQDASHLGLHTSHASHASHAAPAAHSHQHAVALLALAMQRATKALAQTFELPEIVVRIGIHTGEVVAGVIGTKKLAYDLWGDTVNIASRMESHSEAGRIHISEAVYAALQAESSTQALATTTDAPRLSFEKRSGMNIKGKGMMQTYFLSEAHDESSENSESSESSENE
jgi:adenylate cyclase